jgi:hypothetical protein
MLALLHGFHADLPVEGIRRCYHEDVHVATLDEVTPVVNHVALVPSSHTNCLITKGWTDVGYGGEAEIGDSDDGFRLTLANPSATDEGYA